MSELFGPVSPVLVIAMIAGIVEFLKKLGVVGNASLVASLVIALVLGTLLQIGDLYPNISVYVQIAVYSILFALTASGLYDLGRRFARGE